MELGLLRRSAKGAGRRLNEAEMTQLGLGGASSEAVVVDGERCIRLAQYLATVDMPPDTEEPSASVSLSLDILANMYWAAVAICHQTSPRDGPALRGTVNGKD